MKVSRTEEIVLKHGEQYRLGYPKGFFTRVKNFADDNYDFKRCDYLIWNSSRFRFERDDVFEKLPTIFEHSFLVFGDSLGAIKFDGEYALKLFSEGNLEIN
jgi:hypothetical protein